MSYLNKKRYFLGLDGELLVENIKVFEQGSLNLSKIKNSSGSGEGNKTSTPSQSPGTSTKKFDVKGIDDLREKLSPILIEIDKQIMGLYSSLRDNFKNRQFWTEYGVTGYFDDDELTARSEVFGVDTAGAHPTPEEIKKGFSSGIGWWGDNGYPVHKRVNKQVSEITAMIESFAKNNKIKIDDLYSDYEDIDNVKEQAKANLTQIYTVFSKVVDKINRGGVSAWESIQNVVFTYISASYKLQSNAGDTVPASSTKYSFSVDF
jgi:hypothetical protein